MKSEVILNAIGQLDDNFIEEAAPKTNTAKKRSWIKWCGVAACAVFLLSAVFIPKLFMNTEVTPTTGDLRPMILVNDTLYFDTGKTYQNMPDDYSYIGEVTSIVSPNVIPVENFQANFVSLGSKVYQHENSIIISVNNLYCEYGIEILLDFPLHVFYPAVKDIGIAISYYPLNAIYCDITSGIGTLSDNRLYLEKGNQIKYSLNDSNISIGTDAITLSFYDKNGKLVAEEKIFVDYDSEYKRFNLSTLNGRRLLKIEKQATSEP